MHYLSYHCSIKKCVKEPHNSSRRQSPWSYAGLLGRWWNSQIPWQWWITPHVTHSNAKRSVKATDMENGGLFKLHEEKFGMFHCFLFILIIEVFKWNDRDAKPSQWLGWFISTWQWCYCGGFCPGRAWAGDLEPCCSATIPMAQLAPHILTKGAWHMGFFFSNSSQIIQQTSLSFSLRVKMLTWCNKSLTFTKSCSIRDGLTYEFEIWWLRSVLSGLENCR